MVFRCFCLIALFSGVISGALLIQATTVLGVIWLIFGLLWLGLVGMGALLIFLVRDYVVEDTFSSSVFIAIANSHWPMLYLQHLCYHTI